MNRHGDWEMFAKLILQLNSRILQTCTHYANYTASFARYISQSDPTLSAAQPNLGRSLAASTISRAGGGDGTDLSKLVKMEDLLTKFEDNFSRHLKILLDTLNYLAATETVVFLSLCARLSTGNGGGEDERVFG